VIELINNILQFLVALLATIGAGVLFYKSRKQIYLLLTWFYGAYALGALYWTLHFILFQYTPQIFYVSEIAWIASSMFLLTIEHTLPSSEERKFRHWGVWLVPVFCVPQLILYLYIGDILFNLLISGVTMAIAWYSVRGLMYARQQQGKAKDMQFFHLAVIVYIVLLYLLWTSSCFWISDTYTNPYFWIDFMLTASLFIILPAAKKAVST